MKIGKKKGNKFSIKVNVRIKPQLSERIHKFNSKSGNRLTKRSKWKENIIHVGEKRFNFPHKVFLPSDDQDCVFENSIPNLLNSFLNGIDSCIFCYGQTGSGKTHTVFGPPGSLTEQSVHESSSAEGQLLNIPPDWGIFPRCMIQLLNQKRRKEELGMKFDLKVSVIEVYFDQVFDLLNGKKRIHIAPGKANSILPGTILGVTEKRKYHNDRFGRSTSRLQESKKRQLLYSVKGEKEIELNSELEIIQVCKLIEAARTSKSTDMNNRSSRSHCHVSVNLVQQKESSSSSSTKKSKKKKKMMMMKTLTSKMIFVDLAGSERVKKSQVTGCRKKEALNVNTSLTCLGRTIRALSSSASYVPFRDSALTMMLKNCLGGNCRTLLIVTICENDQHGEESLSTLRFGERCSKVKNRIKRNESILSPKQSRKKILLEIKKLKEEMKKLELKGMKGGINDAFPVCTQQSFWRNKKILEDGKKDVLKYTQLLTEKRKKEEKEEVRKKLKNAKKVVEVHYGIVVRMIFSGLYTPPKPIWEKKEAELKSLKNQLERL